MPVIRQSCLSVLVLHSPVPKKPIAILAVENAALVKATCAATLSPAESSHAGSEAPARSHRRKSPPDAGGSLPPRPQNPFFLFKNATKGQVKLLKGETSRHISINRAAAWRAMSEEERRPWRELAARLKAEHYAKYWDHHHQPGMDKDSAEAVSHLSVPVPECDRRQRDASPASSATTTTSAFDPAELAASSLPASPSVLQHSALPVLPCDVNAQADSAFGGDVASVASGDTTVGYRPSWEQMLSLPFADCATPLVMDNGSNTYPLYPPPTMNWPFDLAVPWTGDAGDPVCLSLGMPEVRLASIFSFETMEDYAQIQRGQPAVDYNENSQS